MTDDESATSDTNCHRTQTTGGDRTRTFSREKSPALISTSESEQFEPCLCLSLQLPFNCHFRQRHELVYRLLLLLSVGKLPIPHIVTGQVLRDQIPTGEYFTMASIFPPDYADATARTDRCISWRDHCDRISCASTQDRRGDGNEMLDSVSMALSLPLEPQSLSLLGSLTRTRL